MLNSSPILLQGEEKLSNWTGTGKWESFLSKYFDNSVSGVRDFVYLGKICGVLKVVEQDEATIITPTPIAQSGQSTQPVLPDQPIWHKNSGLLDNWIISNYINSIHKLFDASTQSDTELQALLAPNPNYPEGVYGPDFNGWFWKRHTVNGQPYFTAWPEKGEAGHDPFQPNQMTDDSGFWN